MCLFFNYPAFFFFTFLFHTDVQIFGLIVYFCASSGSWTTDTKTNEEICMFNLKSFGCHIGGVVGFTSVIGAAVFVGGEYYFENVPSVKSRKHYVLIDLGFSGKN